MRRMPIDRRRLLVGSPPPRCCRAAHAAPLSAHGLDAAQFGVRPGAPDDQSRAAAARYRPGRARARAADAGARRLPRRRLAPARRRAALRRARRDAPRCYTRGPSLLAAEGGDSITLSGLTLDGGQSPLPQNRGLVHLSAGESACASSDCTDRRCRRQCHRARGLRRHRSTATPLPAHADNALFCNDSRGLVIRCKHHPRLRQWRHPRLAKR